MRRLLYSFIFIAFFASLASAQTPVAWTSADMYLAIRKLKVLGAVLYVAAHPDDENTRLITYLSKEELYRTGYLSLTRGDGGQNLIGDEQGVELGLIRTQELLAARRIDGGEQFFSRAYDFGYSKNPEETMKKWNREKVLSDVVWVIRKFQPDIIITRFPTTGEGGHGHHTASAILANEAYAAAADPTRFPEQLQYVKTWQVKRVVWNTFNFGNVNTITPDQLRVDVGGYNPLLGKSYGEIAAESRSQHKSQGFGVPASRGESFESFKTTSGPAPEKDLLEGIDISWKRVPGGEAIDQQIAALIKDFDLLKPQLSVQGLVQLYKSLQQLPESNWRNQKLREVQELVAQCSGLFLDVTTTSRFAVQKDSLRVNFLFNNRLGTEAILQEIHFDSFDTTFVKELAANRNTSYSRMFPVPATKPISQPYWLANKMDEGSFNVNDQQKIGQPDADPAFEAIISVKIYGETFRYTRKLFYKFTDPVKGELYEPLVVLPAMELKFVNENNFSVNDSAINVGLEFNSNSSDSTRYAITLQHSDQWKSSRGKIDYVTYRNLSNASTSVFTPLNKKPGGREEIAASAMDHSGHVYSNYHVAIHYDHIPYIIYYKPATAHLLSIDLKTYGRKIGYIIGAGDKVPAALEQMGYEVTLLTQTELARNNLQAFDAIITGVRAYNTNEWMNAYFDKLMTYVKNGGNLIVQYNTNSNIGQVRARIGPYPFEISRTRITDEQAPVTFTRPEHPALNFPNKITTNDFTGWIQERSIYHAAGWDKNFESILSMNDPGEKPDEGSLIVSRYGKGIFTYTGLVFFRELPAAVPGAYRLLANLIALNKKKGF